MNKLLFLTFSLSLSSLHGMHREVREALDLADQWNIDANTFNLTDSPSEYITRHEKSEDDDGAIGVVTIAIKDPNLFEACCFGDKRKAYIDVIAVDPSYRRRGIARKLVNDLLNAIQHDPHIGEIVALVNRDHVKHDEKDSACLKHDFPAIQLFKKLGFIEQSTPSWAPRQFAYSFDHERKQN